MKKTLATLAAAATLTLPVQAEQFWADNSVSVLNGSSYVEPFAGGGLDPENEIGYTTLTLEHVSGHSWGGLFYFVDHHSGDGFTDTYMEFSPSFSLMKTEGMVSSVNLAYTMESMANLGTNHLFGIGADLKVPGLDFFNATVYSAKNDGGDDDTQLTLVYGYSNGNLIIDGFMDYSFGADVAEDQMNFTPQITYNVGPALGLKNKVKVGVEYSYWTGKYGVKDADQNAVSLLIKAHL